MKNDILKGQSKLSKRLRSPKLNDAYGSIIKQFGKFIPEDKHTDFCDQLRRKLNGAYWIGRASGDELLKPKKRSACPQFPYFGAQYPDACCVDGQLYDLDNCDDEGNFYEPDEYHPCPFCNTKEFMKVQKDNEQDLSQARQWMKDVMERWGNPHRINKK